MGVFRQGRLSLSDVDQAGLACVVPVLSRAWRKCLTATLGKEPHVIDPRHDYGLEVDMPNPGQVGADRIANAIAARTSYGAPVIVVDFGTATNIDVVDARGAYRGGTIAPGLMLSGRRALLARGQALERAHRGAARSAWATDTETAVQSGLVIGAAVQAEGLVARIKAELGIEDAPVIGTGGLARTVSGATDLFDFIDPDLTLRGIFEMTLRAEADNVKRDIGTQFNAAGSSSGR